MTVIVVGDIVTDIIAVHSGFIAIGSDTPADISVSGGGSAANTAAWLASLGCSVSLAAVVGRDAAGDDRVAELAAAGVQCGSVRRSTDARTGSVIVLTHRGERSMLSDRGANLLLRPSDVDACLTATAGAVHLHLSGYTLLDEPSRAAGRHALAAARARGLTISVDAASAAPLRRIGGGAFLDWVRGVDIVLANLDEARALLDDTASDATQLALGLTRVARQAVVTSGPMGAIWASADAHVAASPAVAASTVDPTGAGDAFRAGLLASWLAGDDAPAFLRAGVRLGAEAVGVVGGRPAVS
jgi:ribokinase